MCGDVAENKVNSIPKFSETINVFKVEISLLSYFISEPKEAMQINQVCILHIIDQLLLLYCI